MKICTKCKINLFTVDFYKDKSKKDGLYAWCKKCNLFNTKRSQKELRQAIIKRYGNKCVCCGENRYEFLTFEHKNGNGAEHRREIGIHGGAFVNWLKINNYPNFIEILCYNCNCSKGFWGYCPHKH